MKKLVFFIAAILICTCDARKKPLAFTDHPIGAVFANPNFVKDRYQIKLPEPTVPQHWYYTFDQNYSYPTPQPRPDFYDPYIEDKCSPSICAMYYNPVCGLNRKNMRFRWFNSMCHLIMNNRCSNALGTLLYDAIKYENCVKYVFFRSGDCPKQCPEAVEPICGQSNVDGHFVAFQNACFMAMRNCDPGRIADEYKQTSQEQCSEILEKALHSDEE